MGWFGVGVWVRVCVLLREEGVEVGGAGVCLLWVVVVVDLMCVFLRVWGVLIVLRAWLVSSRVRQVTYLSSSPVRTYFRCDRATLSASLSVSEGGDVSLVYGSEVDKVHV